ncbi:unnamed protein product, partial [Amoebophrya sp. A120]
SESACAPSLSASATIDFLFYRLCARICISFILRCCSNRCVFIFRDVFCLQSFFFEDE